MAYGPRKTKISQFTAGSTLTGQTKYSSLQDGLNKTFTLDQMLEKVAEVYGASFRVYEFESELVASDIAIGEYAIVEETSYGLYKITSNAATGNDIALDSGFTATWENQLGGFVIGPASSTDDAIALYDGTSGALLKDGPAISTLALASDVATNTAAIASNSAAISTNSTNISTNSTNITNNTDEISRINSKEVADYAEALALNPADYEAGEIIYVTDDGIAGPFKVVASAISASSTGVLLSNATWNAAGKHLKRVVKNRTYYTAWFVDNADGNTDNSAGTQACIDAVPAGGTIVFNSTPGGSDYRVTATKGTNDKYGLNIAKGNITVIVEDGVTLRRLSSDISTYALAFPLFLVGVADNNATRISNVKIKNLECTGEDTRHAVGGSALMDGRQAIWLKNVKNFTAYGCRFNDIDSGAIWAQAPGEFDYENSEYYNTTKCKGIKILNCEFIAQEHSTNGRNLLHALSLDADDVKLINNEFEWCDVGLTCTGTYDEYDDLETDTYTDSNLSVAVQRTGKGYIINGNTFKNSSEHALYLEAMNISLNGNDIIVENHTVCNTSQLQIRGRNVSISGGTMVGVARAADINTGSMDVNWQGTTIQAFADGVGGIINVQSSGLTAYINSRGDYYGSYKAMKNIRVAVTLNMPDAAQTNGVACRIITDTSDANYVSGQMFNVDFNGTTINNAQHCFYMLNVLGRQINLSGVVANGKPFVESTFSSTGATSTSFIAVDDSSSYQGSLQNVTMDFNRIRGFEYILYDFGAAGSAGTFYPPYGIRGNRMDYIENWDTAAFRAPSYESVFAMNNGQNFLDRSGWFSAFAIHNSLSDGTSNSEKKTMFVLAGSTDVRIYYDDAGGFKAL